MFDSYLNSLSHFNTILSFSHLNSAKPIRFSFFFKISSFEDKDDNSSAEILCTMDWVRLASELGTPINLSDPTIRSETKMVTENWLDMEDEVRYYLDSSNASFGAMGFLFGAKVSKSSVAED